MLAAVEQKKLQFIANCVKNYKGDSKALEIIDIGCGKGWISFYLINSGYRVTGIDRDWDAVTYCSNELSKSNLKASFICADAENLKELEKEFDIIICADILEHLKHPEKLISWTKKHLKNDGLLIVTIPNGYGPGELRWLWKRKKGEHVQWFTTKRFIKMLEDYEVLCIGHSDFIGFPYGWKLLTKIDCWLADKLPHFLVSGWYFCCRVVS